MVDLATFRTFPRASPSRRSETPVADQDAAVEKGIPTDEALASQFTQEVRARRRAARTDLRESELWAEPTPIAEPPPPPIEPPLAAMEPAAVLAAEADHAEPSTHHGAPAEAVPEAPAYAEAPVELDPIPVAAVAEDPKPLRREDEPVTRDPAPALVPSHHAAVHDEVLAEEEPPFSAEAVDEGVPHSVAEPTPVMHGDFATKDPWPHEPPTIFGDEEMLPIAPPRPLEPEPSMPVEAAPEPYAMPPEEQAPGAELRDYYGREQLTLDYRLLGLANPLVCTVTGQLGDAAPVGLTIGGAGVYRPDGFRPAPWSGFAYDVSPDGTTGFVVGTRVLTARGEVAVEDLTPGDNALALRGPALIPILWIGRSMAAVPPVEIAAHAFGPGRPGKTLRVGADHPIFMQSMPVLARDLVNGDTIRAVDGEAAELFHVDVGLAEVLLVEGVPLSSGCR